MCVISFFDIQTEEVFKTSTWNEIGDETFLHISKLKKNLHISDLSIRRKAFEWPNKTGYIEIKFVSTQAFGSNKFGFRIGLCPNSGYPARKLGV